MKIGLLGAGHLGKIHIKCIREIPEYTLTGFYDPDDQVAALVESEFGLKRFTSLDEFILLNDAVDIVTPTISHFDLASKAIKMSKHVFIEKPIVNTPEEARLLLELVSEANVKVQVGHVERFNPAFIAAKPYFTKPLFIESHRLAQFNPRGTDVPVVLDLMIHDIDIILSIVKSNIKKISASGVSIISDTHDITNARLEFDNGCVANLTASRISLKNMRKSRFFQDNAYISVDFLNKKTEIIRIKNIENEAADPFAIVINPGGNKPKKQLIFENPNIEPSNAIKSELLSFYQSIVHNTSPEVSIEDGYQALEVAFKIMEKLNN